jgi:hypothetical protein
MLLTSAAIDVADHNSGMERTMLAIKKLLIIAFISFTSPYNLKIALCLRLYLLSAEEMPRLD